MDYSPQALLDLRYPDFTARHVFTAKLRLVIIVSFWLLCVFFYPGLLSLDQPIMLLISGTFVITTICYAFILKGYWPVFFFIIELVADVAAQTVLVYLTGGANGGGFSIYIVYAAAGGLFYNYRVSIVISGIILFFYSSLLLATHFGRIHEFAYPFGDIALLSNLGPFQSVILLLIFLTVGVYGIQIASYFTKIRETALETKNRELIALNRISSVTRSVITLKKVVNEILEGVCRGMGYEWSLFLHHDSEAGQVRLFVQEDSPIVQEMEKILGFKMNSLHLPLTDNGNTHGNLIYRAMQEERVMIRYELQELFRGFVPSISAEQAESCQRRFGLRKFVAAPLVAEGKVLGALIGAGKQSWLESDIIHSFEGFADQASLTLDNAILIAELKKKNIELERVSRVKSEFLATMSHELRTPLTAIIGFSELLLEKGMGEINKEQQESLREILANGENLLQMINGVLDLAKIESGKMELIIGPIGLGDLLERIQRMISSLIQKKSQQLLIHLPDPFPLVYADEQKLQQILLNLLSNAIKFTPRGGKIEVDVSYRSGGKDPDSFQICISDTGIGIKKEDLKTVFESFRQADSSFTREYQGTGLGLALVKQFVDLHGGKIWVESEKGKGTKFIFNIPLSLV